MNAQKQPQPKGFLAKQFTASAAKSKAAPKAPAPPAGGTAVSSESSSVRNMSTPTERTAGTHKTASAKPAPAAPAGAAAGAASAAAEPAKDKGTPENSVKQPTLRWTLFVDEEVFEAVGERCKASGLNRTQLMLLALNKHLTDLPNLLSANRPLLDGEDGPFSIGVVVPKRTAKKQLSVYPLQSVAATIDAEVSKAQAPDRSYAINTVLRAFLNL